MHQLHVGAGPPRGIEGLDRVSIPVDTPRLGRLVTDVRGTKAETVLRRDASNRKVRRVSGKQLLRAASDLLQRRTVLPQVVPFRWIVGTGFRLRRLCPRRGARDSDQSDGQ